MSFKFTLGTAQELLTLYPVSIHNPKNVEVCSESCPVCNMDEKLYDRALEANENGEMERIEGTGVWVLGHDGYPVAIFRYPEQADDWSYEMYPGSRFTRSIEMRMESFFEHVTKREFEEAREKAKEWSEMFQQSPQAEDDD